MRVREVMGRCELGRERKSERERERAHGNFGASFVDWHQAIDLSGFHVCGNIRFSHKWQHAALPLTRVKRVAGEKSESGS